jgi:hypothetical protein
MGLLTDDQSAFYRLLAGWPERGRAIQRRLLRLPSISVVPSLQKWSQRVEHLPARTLRRNELRRDTPLEAVIESFFIHQSIKPKTKKFCRTQFRR